MEYSVKLDRLSPKVAFPERLRERMIYDPARGQLSYRGFMTKCTYDELAALDDDPHYRRALEELFVLTSAEVAPRAKGRSYAAAIMLATVAAALVVAVVLWSAMRQASQGPGNSIVTTNASGAP